MVVKNLLIQSLKMQLKAGVLPVCNPWIVLGITIPFYSDAESQLVKVKFALLKVELLEYYSSPTRIYCICTCDYLNQETPSFLLFEAICDLFLVARHTFIIIYSSTIPVCVCVFRSKQYGWSWTLLTYGPIEVWKEESFHHANSESGLDAF